MSVIDALQYLADYCYQNNLPCDLETGLDMVITLDNDLTDATVANWISENV